MGKISKAETDDFLTTIMKREKKMQGPCSYKPNNVSSFSNINSYCLQPAQRRAPEAKLHVLINEKKGWKPVKQEGKFDYEMATSKSRVMPKTLVAHIGKERGTVTYERVTYCT